MFGNFVSPWRKMYVIGQLILLLFLLEVILHFHYNLIFVLYRCEKKAEGVLGT